MVQCAQIAGQSTARLSTPSKTKNNESPSQQTLRGLELIKSCARFYENGVGVVKPAVHLSLSVGAVNKPCTGEMRLSKASIGTVAVMCSFFLVLPSLALATIVWWGATKTEAVGRPEVAAKDSSAVSAQFGKPATLQATAGAQTVSNEQSDIIVHKVKTQPIRVDAGGGSDPR